MNDFKILMVSKKDGHLIHQFPSCEPFTGEPFTYPRAREVMLGIRRRLPALSKPGAEAYLAIRPAHLPQPDMPPKKGGAR